MIDQEEMYDIFSRELRLIYKSYKGENYSIIGHWISLFQFYMEYINDHQDKSAIGVSMNEIVENYVKWMSKETGQEPSGFAKEALQCLRNSKELAEMGAWDAMGDFIEKVLPFDIILATQINELELSTRTLKALIADQIVYVGDLVQRTENMLMKAPAIGKKTCAEIKLVLDQMGLTFGMQVEGWTQNYIEIARGLLTAKRRRQ